MSHQPRNALPSTPTQERWCDECGQSTIWQLTLISSVPTQGGIPYAWICSGRGAESRPPDE